MRPQARPTRRKPRVQFRIEGEGEEGEEEDIVGGFFFGQRVVGGGGRRGVGGDDGGVSVACWREFII